MFRANGRVVQDASLKPMFPRERRFEPCFAHAITIIKCIIALHFIITFIHIIWQNSDRGLHVFFYVIFKSRIHDHFVGLPGQFQIEQIEIMVGDGVNSQDHECCF